MLMDTLKEVLEKNSLNLTNEFKRIFHGRGEVYENWKFLTIDSIDDILSVAFYSEISLELETELLNMLVNFIQNTRHSTIILQRRYIDKTVTEVIIGRLTDENIAVENNLKFKLNLQSNQNSGYFPDMKNGREYINNISKDKKVLNLFSYTCGFSLAALKGGAKSVVNMDMAKGALNTGRVNHQLNNLDTKKVKFYPHNILKSFGRIKRDGPFDIIIIDPPTFQRGSFEATKDYQKIIKKLHEFASEGCTVLACLNAPQLDENYIINIFKEFAPNFSFVKRLDNPKEFETSQPQRALKNLVFNKLIIP
ncbi:MAG: class I SAM-dependent methyltransferase [Arcobacteraceae bacterium]|nr:class I SAM-dependent methyltransferase [Arcobacteraceae bacterium]